MTLIELVRRRARALAGERSGATALEFAILAPVLFLAVIGIIELAIVLLIQVLLEGSVREASRFGITGYTPAGVTRDTQIRNVVARYTIGLINPNAITITTKVYPSFGQIGQPEPYTDSNHNGHYDAGEPYTDINGNGRWDADMGASGSGSAGDVVLYTVSYDWHMITGLMRPLMGTNGVVHLQASIAVRNEPW